MRLTRRKLLGALGATATLSGCAGDDTAGGQTTTATEAATETPTEAGPTVQVRAHDELGEILAGPEGMTLYMFDNDTNGTGASSCHGGCAQSWPPLTVEGDPSAGDGVTAELTTFQREDGERQVAADGWPLYYFASDGGPGDANGQGVNDVWWVLRPDGTPVTPEATGTTTEASGGGYSY